MAVEVKEIMIKAVLTDEKTQSDSSVGHAMNKEAMVQECVNQVLKVLKKKNSR